MVLLCLPVPVSPAPPDDPRKQRRTIRRIQIDRHPVALRHDVPRLAGEEPAAPECLQHPGDAAIQGQIGGTDHQQPPGLRSNAVRFQPIVPADLQRLPPLGKRELPECTQHDSCGAVAGGDLEVRSADALQIVGQLRGKLFLPIRRPFRKHNRCEGLALFGQHKRLAERGQRRRWQQAHQQ